MKEETIEKLNSIIDEHTKSSVGILLKRLEDLQLPPKQSLSFDQTKIIYSSLLKNTLYEQSRFLKKLIKAHFEKGSIIFE